ncbi:MAG TPA: hypothetical protein VHV10_13935, partial [Ktedonobacteraceae bacterium]|nr:hypothetical protein [Ktedonobacteraceae bacterium]
KSILQPQGTVMSGLAVAGSVYAIYQLDCGNVASAHASDANHGALETSRKKAAWTSFIMVSAITLITRDAGVGTLGYASIIAMDLSYRHAIMVDPNTGVMQPPAESSYQQAENVVPLNSQGYAVG